MKNGRDRFSDDADVGLDSMNIDEILLACIDISMEADDIEIFEAVMVKSQDVENAILSAFLASDDEIDRVILGSKEICEMIERTKQKNAPDRSSSIVAMMKKHA